METITKKTATSLTSESVSILTQQVYYTTEKEMQLVEDEWKEVDVEKEVQVGSNHRCAYSNSESGRAMLAEKEPEEIVAEVIAVWGDAPTVEEPKYDGDYTPEPTLAERVATIEETLASGGGTGEDVWREMALAIEEGVNEV